MPQAKLQEMEFTLRTTLRLERRPVAVTYLDTEPTDIPRFQGSMPAGCGFWRLAQEGMVFYTVPADHYNCPVGSHTHHIPLPPERAQELDKTLGLMIQIGYLKMEEVPAIPRLSRTPSAIVYAPLAAAPREPDAVILAGRPGRLMMLQEAAVRAGALAQFPALGRPTCMALAAAMAAGGAMSTGCIGNRVYTDLGEDELYVVIRGSDIGKVAAEAETIASANAALASYHKDRRQSLTQPPRPGQ
jgi:uncharacterized protein (DUF169 family)